MAYTLPLLVINSRATVYAVPLTDATHWTIGRSQSNDIVLHDRWISRKHAYLDLRESWEFFITDLGSRNGTWVDGQRIKRPARLLHAKQFRIGDHFLELRLGSGALQGTCPPGESHRVVLLTAPAGFQGQIWRELLISQGITALCDRQSRVPDLLENIYQTEGVLPDLLIMVGEPTELEPILRHCQKHFPKLPVVLAGDTQSSAGLDLPAWAKSLGALDWLNCLPENDFVAQGEEIAATLNCVLDHLDWRPLREPELASVLLSLQAQVIDDTPSQILGEFV